MAWAEGDVLIDAAIFAEGDLAFSAAIKIVEDGPGHAAPGEGAEICDADHTGRGDGAGGLSHSVMAVAGAINRSAEKLVSEQGVSPQRLRPRFKATHLPQRGSAAPPKKSNIEFFSRLLKQVDGITDKNQARNLRHAREPRLHLNWMSKTRVP